MNDGPWKESGIKRTSVDMSMSLHRAISKTEWGYSELLSAGLVHLTEECRRHKGVIEKLRKVNGLLQQDLHRAQEELDSMKKGNGGEN